MGNIVVSENVSLDGVVQDATGDEGLRVGGWVGRGTRNRGAVGAGGREDAAKILLDEALRAEALLWGRRTYEAFAARWPSRTGKLADRMNSVPKYVVSSTLERPEWSNTTVLKGDAVSQVSKLKQGLDGEIVIGGSGQLVRTLIEQDLVDQLRLMVYPPARIFAIAAVVLAQKLLLPHPVVDVPLARRFRPRRRHRVTLNH